MDFSTRAVLVAFALTLVAGLATGVGSAIALLSRRANRRFLSLALGISAAVMLYVSFVELFPAAIATLRASLNMQQAVVVTSVAFVAGMALIAVVDRLLPHGEHSHRPGDAARLSRLGLLSAVAIAVHNFPEGLATFVSGLAEPSIAYPVAVAIALHNVPEGVAVSILVFLATGNRRKAFFFSFLSGLAEPLGALAGFLLLFSLSSLTPLVTASLSALVAGIMTSISLLLLHHLLSGR